MNAMIKSIIERNFGRDITPIVEYILKTGEVDIDTLARKFKLGQTTIRKILYYLESHNIVSSKRVQNGVPGHFNFLWSPNIDSLNSFQKRVLIKELKSLKTLYNSLPDVVFVCPSCGLKLDVDSAMEYGFRCPEDGDILVQRENEEKKEIARRIVDIEEVLKELEKNKIADIKPNKKNKKRNGKSKKNSKKKSKSS